MRSVGRWWWCPVLSQGAPREGDRGHGAGPAGIERVVVGDRLDQFRFGEAIRPGTAQVPDELLGVAGGDQAGDRYLRAVPRRALRAGQESLTSIAALPDNALVLGLEDGWARLHLPGE